MPPSVKTLKSAFPKLTDEQVQRIRSAMTGHTPKLRAMNIIDEVLGTFGVEYIPAGHNSKSPSIYYCNAGDTYDPTIMLVRGNFRVGAWGDIVERGHYD